MGVGPERDQTRIVHATSVALDSSAVLIRGGSGSGKSALGLHLLALGAKLVADDQTVLSQGEASITVSPPPTLPKGIEARGIGILAAPITHSADLRLVVDMDTSPQSRLPSLRFEDIFGVYIPLWAGRDTPSLAPAILLFLQYGWGEVE